MEKVKKSKKGSKTYSIPGNKLNQKKLSRGRPVRFDIDSYNEDLWRGPLHGSNSDSGGLLKDVRGSMNVF